jgi:predicted ATPase/DNA-binding SARP family transcriptional activator/DNA-binding CsgD family transcriptional regulator
MCPPSGSEGVAQPEAVRVWLLGDFRVSVGLRRLERQRWRLRKAASLVKLLALAPGHRLHREQVAELLWPHLDSKAALNNLHYAIHHARQALEPRRRARSSRYVVFRDELLTLCPEIPLWCDVEAFEMTVERARRARQPATYRAAIDLYTGDLLPQDRYEVWTEERRERLRRSCLELLVELARIHEQRDETEPAVQALNEAVAKAPTLEEAHARLMRVYAASGRRHEAILQYGRLRTALLEELEAEPGEVSQRLYEEIRAGRFRTAGPPREKERRSPEEPVEGGKHNLPAIRTSFVGRERELAELKRELAAGWLVTLTGVGGCGKTRLALEASRSLLGAYPDGAWRVNLVGLTEPELVPQAVAAAINVREQPNRMLADTLVDALRSRQMLLILDNCEHVRESVSRLTETLLGACPRLRILATSREPLGVMGEVRWRVPSLSFPAAQLTTMVEDLSDYESVRLFVERAWQHDPAFVLTEWNARAVAMICRKLEGIPLAVELAAARTGVLSAEQIANKLEKAANLLATGDRMADPRHRTLRGMLDWSYDLLDAPERSLFGRLSVFAGGWTLEAAEAVGAGGGIEEDEVLDILSHLVDKSLVVAEPGKEGVRYRMLEPVRQYGSKKLEESEQESGVAQHRHATFFLALAQGAEPHLRGARQGEWLERLELEHDNLRAALSWALEGAEAELALRLGGALGEFWHVRGHLSEGRRWLQAALAQSDAPDAARAKALSQAGYIAWEQGDYQRSVALSQESLALSRKLGDKVSASTALYTLAWAALFSNELEQASTLTEEALKLQRETNDTVSFVRTLLIVGLVAVGQHDHERAIALHEETLALARKEGDGFAMVLSLGLGQLASLGLGDYQRVRTLLKGGFDLSRRLKMMHLTAANLHLSALLSGVQAQPVRAARLWGAAESLREVIGTLLSPWERHVYGPYIDAARAQLDEAAWEAAWAEGRAMPLEEAAEYALSEEELASPATSTPEPHPGKAARGLTEREEEVAFLVARGLTSRQIAAELSISAHTVDTHVRRILKKLGLRSRAQITA